MQSTPKVREIAIGGIGTGLALLFLFYWIPKDIDTGVIDVWRRSVIIGDAMLPTFASVGILLSSLVIVLRAFAKPVKESARQMSITYIVQALILLAIGFVIMANAGPVFTALFAEEGTTYRLLLATAPWKYSGFILGGTFLTFSFISLSYHRPSRGAFILALVSTVLIAAMYDLPFDNLLLPPNGDF